MIKKSITLILLLSAFSFMPCAYTQGTGPSSPTANNISPFTNNIPPSINGISPFTNNNIPFINGSLPFVNNNMPFTSGVLPFTNNNLPFNNNILPFTNNIWQNTLFPGSMNMTLPNANIVGGIQSTIMQGISLPPEITLCEPAQVMPVNLEQSLITSLDKNLGIKIITTQKNRDKWLFYNNLTTFLPDIDLSYVQTRFTGAFLLGGVVAAPPGLLPTGPFNSVVTGVNVNWVGFNGFARYFNSVAAQKNYKASQRNVDLTRDQVLLQTATQYYTLLQRKLNTEILTTALAQTEAQLGLNQARYNAGVGTRFDVLRAQAQVASATQDLINAYNSFKFAQAQLANTMGIDIFTPLIPDQSEAAAKTLFKDCFDLNQVTQIALQSKPELDIARLNIEAARAARNSGFAPYFPTVSMSTGVNGVGRRLTQLSQNNSISLIINWPIVTGLGLGTYTNIRALNEILKESKLRYTDTQRNIEQSLVNSFYNILSTSQLIAASQSEVTSADESLRLALVRLAAGVGIYTDVIDAQLTDTQARVSYLNALTGYNIAQAQLLYDMGVISPANLLNGVSVQELSCNITANKLKKKK